MTAHKRAPQFAPDDRVFGRDDFRELANRLSRSVFGCKSWRDFLRCVDEKHPWTLRSGAARDLLSIRPYLRENEP